MSAPILATKLYVPPPRPNVVPRPRLIGRLYEGLRQNQGFSRKLTLISAPAGFGKTTLVSEWVAGWPRIEPKVRVAWLSLDEGDNDTARFLAYLVAALQTIAPRGSAGGEIGAGVLASLQSAQPPPTELLLTTLLNEIAAVPDHFILVLDDYHVVDSEPIDAALIFLVEHLPPQMHLAIATREDPQLPLARYRARGQLTELRAADLRFTPAEAAEFLNQVMGLSLSPENIAALETRTEGWIAGLQLAAISMRGHGDATGFIQSFTGGHHFVLDYLVEEVLHQQPQSIQAFLLRTSILDRLCGPLCDAVMNGEAGQGTLEYLERANLFIVPLDNERRWYRYHHLFADLLRGRLQQGDDAAELHLRASRWYENNGYEAEAFHHALAAGDYGRAAGLAELAWVGMDRVFQSAAWLGWIKKLPDEEVRARPVLCTQIAYALTDAGELEASESRLRDAERWLDVTEASSGAMVVVDKELFRALPARIAIIRASNAQAQGDFAGTVKYAELALALSSEDDFNHEAATVILGMANWARGELEPAKRVMKDWINGMQKAGNTAFALVSMSYLADMIVSQGRLREAVTAYRQTLSLASACDKSVLPMTANAHLGLALIFHEQDNQEAAAQDLLQSKELGEGTSLIDWPCRWHLAQARLKEAGGDLETALDLLDEARRLYVREPVPDIRPVEALKARVYVKQGRLTRAFDWVRERGLTVDDDLSYLREFEHITLARVLLADYMSHRAERSVLQAIAFLDRLLQAAEAGGRIGSAIEILALQALAHRAQGNIPRALASLERALAFAEPEGYIRVFVDEGPAMADLLARMKAEDEERKAYVHRLLAGCGAKEARPSSVTRQPTVEPLSERELEVLRLLRTDLSGPEIARELMVSLNTLRTHTKNIFGKLGVNSRRAAIHRAQELNLL